MAERFESAVAVFRVQTCAGHSQHIFKCEDNDTYLVKKRKFPMKGLVNRFNMLKNDRNDACNNQRNDDFIDDVIELRGILGLEHDPEQPIAPLADQARGHRHFEQVGIGRIASENTKALPDWQEIAQKLENPHQTEQAQIAEIQFDQEGQIEGNDDKEIEKGHRRERIAHCLEP